MAGSRDVAALANAMAYATASRADVVAASPHLRHRKLREFYSALVAETIAAVAAAQPRVLELGAGDGASTAPLLELGAAVTAVDVSERQLEDLERRLRPFGGRLETRAGDADVALRGLRDEGHVFDAVVAVSFLHHVPDYVGLVRRAVDLLRPRAAFLSFQDPLRYDGLPAATRRFAELAYLGWRVRQGDVIGGARRRLRRSRGVFLNTPEDALEYHAMRGGVDERALERVLAAAGFAVDRHDYFSTQSPLAQRLGEAFRLRNMFAIQATRPTLKAGR